MPAPRRVLVVERRPYVSGVLRALLRLAGVAVDTAPDRVLALAALGTARHAAVIVELDVAGGLDLCRALRERPETARALVVAIDRAQRPVPRDQALAAGCDLFLPQPFDPFSLAALLEQVLPYVAPTAPP